MHFNGLPAAAFRSSLGPRHGHVQAFKKGIFGLAQKFGVPIVPMSIVGSYEFFRTGHWMLHPGKITVYLHDTIDTAQIGRGEVDEVRRRVQEIVAVPVEESLEQPQKLPG